MDLNAILLLATEWVMLDGLAHSSLQGSRTKNAGRDVMDLLNAGINVISAVNIQHMESINDHGEGNHLGWKCRRKCRIACCR